MQNHARQIGKDRQGTAGTARQARHDRQGTTGKAGKAGKADAQQTIDGWFFNIATISVSSRRNRNVACERNASLLQLYSCFFFVPSLSCATIVFHETEKLAQKRGVFFPAAPVGPARAAPGSALDLAAPMATTCSRPNVQQAYRCTRDTRHTNDPVELRARLHYTHY
eukprot:COSAG06_NODE_17216_length_954_cov_1.401170_1_plen_166_part_10